MADTLEVGAACANCGAPVFMVTCHHFRGTGHEWALAGMCYVCRAVAWSSEDCRDCRDEEASRA
jgi:hypothetical protein